MKIILIIKVLWNSPLMHVIDLFINTEKNNIEKVMTVLNSVALLSIIVGI